MFQKLARFASSMNRNIASMTANILNLTQYRNRLGRQIMAGTPETNKPDFRNGFPIRHLRHGSLSSFSYSVFVAKAKAASLGGREGVVA